MEKRDVENLLFSLEVVSNGLMMQATRARMNKQENFVFTVENAAYASDILDQARAHIGRSCTYAQEEADSSTYDCSACGCAWMFTDGGPVENNTRFCPECGAAITHIVTRGYDKDGNGTELTVPWEEVNAN